MKQNYGKIFGHLGIAICGEDFKTKRSGGHLNLDRLQQIIKKNPYSLEFKLIDTIDSYGLTIFNQEQIPIVLNELKLIFNASRDDREKKYIQEIIKFISQTLHQPHIFIKLIGD